MDRNKIAVNKKTFQAKKILISVGGKPFIPNIKGKDLFITSDDALDLKNLPSKIVIYGGGYIALEFACIFSNLEPSAKAQSSSNKSLYFFLILIISFISQGIPR